VSLGRFNKQTITDKKNTERVVGGKCSREEWTVEKFNKSIAVSLIFSTPLHQPSLVFSKS
jgi:hypothetical protein